MYLLIYYIHVQTKTNANLFKFNHIVIVTLFACAIPSYGSIDSLRNVISHAGDTVKMATANKLAAKYEFKNPDSCMYFANMAYNLAESIHSAEGKMEALYNKSLAFYNGQDFQLCVDAANEALEISRNIQDTIFQGYILYKLSRAYSKLAKYDLTIQTQLDAIRFYKERHYPTGWAVMYNNMSIAYKYLGDYREAIKVLRLALSGYKMDGYTAAYYAPYLNIGDNYYKLGLMDSALLYLDSAIVIAKTYNTDNPYLEGYTRYWIGEVWFERGDYEKALENFKAGHEARIQNYDLDAQVYTLLALGRCYHRLKQYSKAKKYLQEALEGAIKVNAIKRIMMAHRALGKLNFETGNYKLAAQHMKEQLALRDSIFNQEKAMAIMNSRTRFQVEAKDKEIEMLSMQSAMAKQEKELAEKNERLKDAALKESESQQMLLYSGLGFLLVSIGGLFYIIRRRNSMNKLLQSQKSEISHQNLVLEEKNREILDSIAYAKRIQSAILPPTKVVKSYLPESFIFYKPKDIVAGDFYWMNHQDNQILFAAADCTGHGVPGAMVSVVCNNGLNRSVNEFKLSDPAKILDKTRELVVEEFDKSEEDVKDGMDIALCSLSLATGKLLYAGANNPLWIIRNGETTIEEVKPDKQPIGRYDNSVHFTSHEITLEKGDTIYIFSDGYADQFGGERGKKLKSNNFKQLLTSMSNLAMDKQKERIEAYFDSWKGDLEQLDDVCVIGVRV